MFFYMTLFPSGASSVAASAPAAPVPGDYLSVAGTIVTGTQQANISFLRRLPNLAYLPPLVPGPSPTQLLGSGDGVLATYAFTPVPAEDAMPPQTTFAQAVPFAPGT